MKRPKILFILLPCLLLAACAGGGSGAGDVPTPASVSTPPPSASPAAEQIAGLRLLTANGGIAATAGGETPDGCYAIDPYPDGTADIVYYDYASALCVRLSADPNAGHTPTSTAYLAATNGGVRCLVAGGGLCVLKNGLPYADPDVPGSDPAARLYRMELDGSNRTVSEYGPNVVFQWDGGVAGDDAGNLYTVLSVVDPETAGVTSVLAKLGRAAAGYETLATWETTAKLAGVCGDGFLIRLSDGAFPGKTSLVLRGADGSEALILEWSAPAVTSYTVYEGLLYYTQNGDAAVYRKDLAANRPLPPLSTAGYGEFTPALALIRCEVRDGRLILQLGSPETDEARYASLDLSTGALQPLTLYCGTGDDRSLVGIYAEGADDFLVSVGEFTRTRTDYGPDGLPYTFEQGFADYALIDKDDYWDGVANYRRFQYYE